MSIEKFLNNVLSTDNQPGSLSLLVAQPGSGAATHVKNIVAAVNATKEIDTTEDPVAFVNVDADKSLLSRVSTRWIDRIHNAANRVVLIDAMGANDNDVKTITKWLVDGNVDGLDLSRSQVVLLTDPDSNNFSNILKNKMNVFVHENDVSLSGPVALNKDGVSQHRAQTLACSPDQETNVKSTKLDGSWKP